MIQLVRVCAAGYYRRADDTANLISRRAIESLARNHRCQVVRWCVESATSTSGRLSQRPQLAGLLREVVAGRIGAIITTSLDEFGNFTPDELSWIVRILDDGGARLLTWSQGWVDASHVAARLVPAPAKPVMPR